MKILRNTENGRCFPYAGNHKLARESWIEVLDIPGIAEAPHTMSDNDKERVSTSHVSKEEIPKDDYETMHYTKIQRKVEAMGREWTNKADGIRLLRELEK